MHLLRCVNNTSMFRRLAQIQGSRMASQAVVDKVGFPKRIKCPLVTMDDIPIPQYPFKELHAKEQKAFNRIMLIGLAYFVVTISFIIYDDTYQYEAWAMPRSYRHRKIVREEK